MEIITLEKIAIDELYEAFNDAFSDYEMQWSKRQFTNMLRRRGYKPEISFAATENDRIVSFTLNASGMYNGKSTVYDTGTGTVISHRKQGLAYKVMEFAIPLLKERKFEQYLLEVLTNNNKAIALYAKSGFQIIRELDYYIQSSKRITLKPKGEKQYSIKEIDHNELEKVQHFMDFQPVWQSNINSIKRGKIDMDIWGVFDENQLLGYCTFEFYSGNISQIAVDPKYRRKNVGTQLVQHILNNYENDLVRILNVDSKCTSIKGFLNALNLEVKGSQYEMIKALS